MAAADAEGTMSKILRASVVGLILAMTTMGAAKEPVSIHVSPAVSFAPADLFIRMSVEPDARNRAIEVIADSDAFYRSSAIQLEGDRAARTTTVQFHSVPPGEYNVTVAVIGDDGRPRGLARAHVNVIGTH